MALEISDAIFEAKPEWKGTKCCKVDLQFLVELLLSFLKHFCLLKTLENWRRYAQNANAPQIS
jgi:hypothetical protein